MTIWEARIHASLYDVPDLVDAVCPLLAPLVQQMDLDISKMHTQVKRLYEDHKYEWDKKNKKNDAPQIHIVPEE